MTINVLFVCLGNICRSPAAEGIFTKQASDRGLGNEFKVDSCGTAPFNTGKPADPRSVKAAARAGYDISQQRARQIEDSDYLHNDYIVAMDHINLTSVQAWAPDGYPGEIKLFMHYSRHSGNAQIADPYYSDEEHFDAVIASLEDASTGLINHIISKHKLIEKGIKG